MIATKLRGDGLWRFVGQGMTLEQAETRLALAEAESYLRQAAASASEARPESRP
jgi:hypothetical protein